jgi:hypothetical protein
VSPRKRSRAKKRQRIRGFLTDLFFATLAILISLAAVAYAATIIFPVVSFAIRHYEILALALILLISPHLILRWRGRRGFIWCDSDGIYRCFEGAFEGREE